MAAGDKEIFLSAQRKAKTNEPMPEDIFTDRHGRHDHPAPAAARRHGEGAGGGQAARGDPALHADRRLLHGRDRGDARRAGALRRAGRADARGAGDLRDLRQAEQAHRARDPDLGADDRRARRSSPTRSSGSCSSSSPTSRRCWRWSRRRSGCRALYELIKAEIEILQVEKKIRTRVKKQMEKTQKEYYLNEQMQAIQKELGDRDEFKNELDELEERVKQKDLSKEAQGKVKKELKKLKMMAPMSAEATVVRNYLDWVLALPWGEKTEDKLDIADAERILDEDHYGLKKVKERILEYLAVQALVEEAQGADPVPGRAARRGQDLAGALDRQGDRAQLRPAVARRRARRGGDSRPPPHVHRRAARQDHPVAQEGGDPEPGLPARRDRQDVDGLSRRPLGGAARGAGPGAEQHLQRSLPGPRLRPVGRDVHHHGELPARDPDPAAGSDGDHPAARLHRVREGLDRGAVPDPQAEARQRHRRRSAWTSPRRPSATSSTTTRRRRASGTSSARSRPSAARSPATWWPRRRPCTRSATARRRAGGSRRSACRATSARTGSVTGARRGRTRSASSTAWRSRCTAATCSPPRSRSSRARARWC